jgi:hypothetical protein
MESRAVIGNTSDKCALNGPNQEESLLNVAEIRKDGGTQHRETDPYVIRQYATLMAAETAFPPLRVWFDGTSYWLTDGFHRLAAAEKCGFKYITAYIYHGSLEDARWDSYSANSQHGLRRKRSDIIRLIDQALKHAKASSLSNVQVAKHLGMPEATVRRWRKRLSSSLDEDGYRIVNRKGTSYSLNIKEIGTHSGERCFGHKSRQQLNKELQEMKSVGSTQINQLLDAIDQWIAGGSAAACLMVMEEALLSIAAAARAPVRVERE